VTGDYEGSHGISICAALRQVAETYGAETRGEGIFGPAIYSAVQDAGEWMTVQAAAETLGITESRVHHLFDAGWLYGRKDGHRRLVWAESVTAELAARLRRPPYPPLHRYS
jgi:hypothetical protein